MRSLALGLALFSSACGPDLGKHRFVSARYASELPAVVSHSREDPGYVVLTFKADVDLNAADINALYVQAVSCASPRKGNMSAFGPFSDTAEPKDLPDRHTAAARRSYLVYVPVTGEIWGDLQNGKTPVVGRFDLRRGDEDICLQLEHTDYPWATRTNSVRVAESVLRQAAEGGEL